jgi:catechol 2,3-dioxygenase-like lactoylglutathione lyase family enzyme
MALRVARVIPVLRIFDVPRAKEFYLDYLGFQLDWEHRFQPEMPLYCQVSRAGAILHLSEHHGDGSPGVVVYVEVSGVRDYHSELHGKSYSYLRPGLEVDEIGTCLEVIDPFGNRIRFNEPPAKMPGQKDA